MKQPLKATEPVSIYAVEPAGPPADLRGALPAMRRAAQRARLTAEQTGTDLIQVRDGKVVRVPPIQKPKR